MGCDERQQSNSSGTLVVVIGVVLVFAILAIVVVGGAALLWVGTVRTESRAAVVAEQRAVIEEKLRAKATAMQSELEEARSEATLDPMLNFKLNLDQEGNTNVDGENIGLDELRTRLAKLKHETSNVLVVHINADPECPVKHIVPVLDVCHEVGDIDYRVESVVQLTATVASYELAAEWDHFDDGKFSAYDKITLNVVAPARHAGTTLSITVPLTELPEDSAFRSAGTRLTFTLQASDLTAEHLAWGAVGNPTVEP